MSKEDLTVFQRLTMMFGFPGRIKKEEAPSYQFSKDEILKTTSREDYEHARLQTQQSQYISDKWTKLEQSLYNQSVYYEPNRLSAYYDFESMEFSVNETVMIPTLTGFESIKDLAARGRDYEFITYAYDHNLKKVVPALARNVHYTRDEMTYKITFDDGKSIIATYGHRFLKRDGVYCKVEDLKPGDSMMPFYRKSFYDNEKYNWVYTCNKNEGHHGWVTEHTLVAEWFYNKKVNNDIEEVHHRDFNGKNNLPDNLEIMTINEHRAFHAQIHNKKMWENPEYRAKMTEIGRRKGKYTWNGKRGGKNNPAYIELPIEKIIIATKKYKSLISVIKELNISAPKIRRVIKNNGYCDWKDFLEKNNIEICYNFSCTGHQDSSHPNYKHIPWDLLVETALSSKTAMETAVKLNVTWHKIIDDLKRNGYDNWNTFMEAYDNTVSIKKEEEVDVVNHKIRFIEPFGVVPVYDLTVPGYKNFATDTIFSHNTPEISAALDIYAEESATLSEKGEILTIFSESTRIKSILEDLFINKLDLNTNIQMWTRGVCKYGDNFVYLKIDPEKGIVGCQQLPNIEIERLEGVESKIPNQTAIKHKARELRFSWKNKDLEFQSWEIAHFRLLGDDRKLPYGTSMLDKLRRIWKQLLLAEDAMLIYRTSRAPERRVFKIFVGNMDDKDIEPYVQRIANKFKRDQVVDSRNGQIDMRYNQMPVWKNTPIPLLDGRTISIEELSKEYELGKTNWVYSIQDKTHNIVPGKVVWCGKNYTAKELIKVWLDDETWIMTAPEHPFVLRDGSHKRADELTPGESLMPFYIKKSSKEDGMKMVDYDMVFNPHSGKYEFVHRIVGNKILKENREETRKKTNFYDNNNLTIHHIDFNKNNNNPENLLWVGNIGHIEYHKHIGKERLIKYNKSEKKRNQNIRLAKEQSWHKRFETYNHSILHKEHDKIRKEAQLRDWSNLEKKKYRIEQMRIKLDDYVFNKINENILNGNITNRKTMIEYLSNNIIDYVCSINKNKRLNNLRKVERTVLEREINNKGFKTITEYISSMKLNHKVLKIEKFYGDEEVYCMTVVGLNGENDRHNFAVKSFQKDGNVSVSGSFTVNSVDQDYFIPVRDPQQTSPIETLPGAANLGEIADIEYIQKKMLTALRIPKAFLGFEEVVGDGKSLALMDIRFARTINRIQKSIIQELNKIALIHLYLIGLEDELNNFSLALTNPSAQSDLLRIEQWKEKILLYKDATSDQSQIGILPVSHTWAKKNILGMSDSEVILDLQQQRLERAIGFELTNTQNIIKRSGVFDDVDKKYGISEKERAALMSAEPSGGEEGAGEMPGLGTGSPPPPGPSAGGFGGGETESLGEGKKQQFINMLGGDLDFKDLKEIFDIDKAQRNIYEINNKLKDILNE